MVEGDVQFTTSVLGGCAVTVTSLTFPGTVGVGTFFYICEAGHALYVYIPSSCKVTEYIAGVLLPTELAAVILQLYSVAGIKPSTV